MTLHRRPNGDYKCDFSITNIEQGDIRKLRHYRTGEIKTADDLINMMAYMDLHQ